MKVSDSAPRSQTAEDRFAQRIVARLNEDALDHAVAERLRAARVRAVAARKSARLRADQAPPAEIVAADKALFGLPKDEAAARRAWTAERREFLLY